MKSSSERQVNVYYWSLGTILGSLTSTCSTKSRSSRYVANACNVKSIYLNWRYVPAIDIQFANNNVHFPMPIWYIFWENLKNTGSTVRCPNCWLYVLYLLSLTHICLDFNADPSLHSSNEIRQNSKSIDVVPRVFLGHNLIGNNFVLRLGKYFVGKFFKVDVLLVVDIKWCDPDALNFSYFSKAKS